jgi:chemotaxis protein CheC
VTEPAGPPGANLAAVRTLSERGFSRAADSLSRLLGHAVRLALRDIRTLPASVLPALAEETDCAPMAGVQIRIRGGAGGRILILLPLTAVYRLLQALLGTPAEPRVLTETERSALQEVGNIVASSFLSELGDVLGRRFVPTAPEIQLDDIPRLVRDVIAGERAFGSEVLVVQGLLEDPDRHIEARVFVMPDLTALEPTAHGASGERRMLS